MGLNPDLPFQYDPDLPLRATGEWTSYIDRPAPPDALVRFKNEITGEEWTGRGRELHPEFNVAYLWWKMTGLERMKNNSV